MNLQLRTTLMERNQNLRIFMCQYAREPAPLYYYNCNLFQTSLTNRGLGYSFNQADFWDLYSSTWYTKEFANIYWPKGFNGSHSDNGKNGWRNSVNNIFYPVRSGQDNGLTVTDIIFFIFSPISNLTVYVLFRYSYKGPETMRTKIPIHTRISKSIFMIHFLQLIC